MDLIRKDHYLVSMRICSAAARPLCLFTITVTLLVGCAGGQDPSNTSPNKVPNNQPDSGSNNPTDDGSNTQSSPFVGQEPMTIVRDGTRGFLLHGVVLTSDDVLENAQVLVIGRDIVCVDIDCTGDPDASSATWIATGGVISPGLIDAHNHLAYNFLPEWIPPEGTLFENRYQWSDDPSYEAHIEPFAANRSSGSHVCPASKWGELRSLIHGTTTMQGQSPNHACVQGGVRNADHANRLQHDHMRTAIGSPREITDEQAESFIESVDQPSEPTTRIAIHMQEGYADNNVLLEFDSWAGRDERPNRHMGTSLLYKETSVLIHSMSLTSTQLDEVAETRSKVVWSPSSNMALYGQTAPIADILSRGIVTGIGPDWTVSGAAEMLSELRFARDYAVQRGVAAVTPKKLWQMATVDGAEVVGLDGHIGQIAIGYRADLVVFGRVEADPYLAVIRNRAQDVGLVMIDGEAYYGDGVLRDEIGRNVGCEAFEVCGVEKFVCARDPDIADGSETIGEIRQRLIDILEGNGYPPEEQYGRGDELLELVDCAA